MDNETRDKILYALNTQRVLCQQGVLTDIRKRQAKSHDWVFEGAEYPVQARNGLQTRIGLVFSHRKAPGFHVGIDCVRPRLDYEAWVFFGAESMIRRRVQPRLFLEIFDRKARERKTNTPRFRSDHRIGPWCDRQPFRIFNHYVEARMDGFNRRRARTDTIEEAFARAVAGQTGLLHKLEQFGARSRACVLPVVVTTAEIFAADFEPAKVALENGTTTRDDLSAE